MKNLLLTLIVFSVLLLIGCQENSITDPVQDSELQKADDPLVQDGTITLERVLIDPYPVMNSYYIINGEIEYQHTLQIIEQVPAQHLVCLKLSVNADFTYWCSVCEPEPIENNIVGFISSVSEDIISVSEGSTYLLQKTYRIEGREDGMLLRCRFYVTTSGIELNEMWLEVGDYDPVTIDPN